MTVVSALEQEACSCSSWIPQYRELTWRSVIIDLPPEFVDFLVEDGIILGDSSQALPRRLEPTTQITEEGGYGDWSDEDVSSGSEEDDPRTGWVERFPLVHAAVEAGIAQLGGRAAPRLSWSAPTDAVWVSETHSLMCTNAEQVILLLKSSDRAAHDVSLAQQLALRVAPPPASSSAAPLPPQLPMLALVLRRWHDLRPEREFRCFVRRHELCAISQRDPSQHFPQLQGEVDRLQAAICEFHARHVGTSFPVPDYAMDVYVATSGAVRIVDFNPIADTTSPLLFEWEELPFAWPRGGDDVSTSGPHLSSDDGDQQQQQQQPSGLEAAGVASEPCAAAVTASHNDVSSSPVGSSSTSGSEGSGSVAGDAVDMRIVEHAGMVQPGVRQACGMPYDMAHLQDSMGDIMALMQRQEQQR